MTIDSSGRVGIGTTVPGAPLQVAGIAKIDSYVDFNGDKFVGRGSAITGGYSADDLVIFNNTATGVIPFRTNGTERARIDSSGRLLVGTSTAITGAASEVRSVQVVHNQNSGNQGLGIYSYNTAGWSPRFDLNVSRTTSIGSHVSPNINDNVGFISFNASDGAKFIPAARIFAAVDGTPGTDDMPGRLVFSTTADGASSPTERMRIKSDGQQTNFSSGSALTYAVSAAAGTIVPIILGRHSGTAVDTGTTSFRVWSNGDTQNTNNSYGAISDAKLKENIVDANSQWSDLKALQVRKYNFKEETDQQTHTQIGLIAQEVELVSPGLVSESPDRDEDGNDLGTVTKSVNYSVLYMKAVKALQEAMERIETLETKVAALEGV
jgi:hypothetical protein